jgi:hypothetical protein
VNEFEFYSVATSIVLALALGKLVSSIPSVFSTARFDSVFGLFFLFALFSSLVHWKMIWDLNSHASWSIGDFALLMAPTVALYLGIHVLVSDAPQEVVSWRDQFQAAHRWFFAAFLVAFLLSQIRDRVLVEEPINWLMVLILGPLLVAGAVLTQRFAHTIIGLLLVAAIALQVWGDVG